MSKHLRQDMDRLRQELLSLFAIVEEMIDDALQALMNRRTDLVRKVIETDPLVDHREVMIEEACLRLLALHQPMASDLRSIATLIKINSDLERIADLACNIAERAQCLHEYPHFPIPHELPEMATLATKMVGMALDSFINLDGALAANVIRLDEQVDAGNRAVIMELVELKKSDRNLIDPALHCFSAARHIERIADHAENIAADVIYIIEGRIVRHKHGDFPLHPETTPWQNRSY